MDIKNTLLALLDLSSSISFTDIHVQSGEPIRWRRPNGWRVIPDISQPFDKTKPEDNWPTNNTITQLKDIQDFLPILSHEWEALLNRHGAIDRPIEIGNLRLRCSAYYANGRTGLEISIRKHNKTPIDYHQMNLPKHIENILSWSKGLIIVSGSTGSGKTTTLASMLNFINKTRKLHIETLENPIEYQLKNDQSIISQVEIPSDSPSFSAALKHSLRHKPDVIMIGEVRDKDTAEAMVQAAESGHLILATLHTNSTESTLTRLLSFFPAEEQAMKAKTLSNSIAAMICQSMVPLDKEDGMQVVHEIFINNSTKTMSMLKDVEHHYKINEYLKSGSDDSRHINIELLKLAQIGKISREIAMRASHSPIELRDMMMSGKKI